MSKVLEAEIRDILATCSDITKEILSKRFEITGELLLRSKEKILNGRSDLIFDAGNTLFLLELKVDEAKIQDFIQTSRYCKALITMMTEGQLPKYKLIRPCLLSPLISDAKDHPCEKESCSTYEFCNKVIYGIEYDIGEILNKFAHVGIFPKSFFSLTPVNLGAYKFYFNKMLKYLHENGPTNIEELTKAPIFYGNVKNKYERLRVYIREAEIFELIKLTNEEFVDLTESGKIYSMDAPIGCSDDKWPDKISRKQAEFLREYIVNNPLKDKTIYGIYSFVESIMDLSKNIYPVPSNEMETYFTWKVGKMYDWKNKRTRSYQIRFFGQYSEQLGLTKKISDRYYITPSGVKLIQHLQLNKIKAML